MSASAVSGVQRLPSGRESPWRSDAALRAMAAKGDAEAFAALYERHQPDLLRYCRSIVGNDDDAHDALHEAMMNAWAALRRGDGGTALRPWLFRIARNEAVNVLRRRRPHGELQEAHGIAAGGTDEALDVRQRMASLRTDLAALPERQRSALLLRELCGFGHDEIAVVLSISPGAVRQAVYEARLALHEAEAGRQMVCAAVERALSDGDGRMWRHRRIRGHLRGCDSCSSFAEALRRRRAELGALFPPLPVAGAARLLSELGGRAGIVGGASSTAAGTAMAPFAGVTTATGSLAFGNLVAGTAAKLALGSVVVVAAGGALAEVELRASPPPAVVADTRERPAPAVNARSEPPAASSPRPVAGPGAGVHPGRDGAVDQTGGHTSPVADPTAGEPGPGVAGPAATGARDEPGGTSASPTRPGSAADSHATGPARGADVAARPPSPPDDPVSRPTVAGKARPVGERRPSAPVATSVGRTPTPDPERPGPGAIAPARGGKNAAAPADAAKPIGAREGASAPGRRDRTGPAGGPPGGQAASNRSERATPAGPRPHRVPSARPGRGDAAGSAGSGPRWPGGPEGRAPGDTPARPQAGGPDRARNGVPGGSPDTGRNDDAAPGAPGREAANGSAKRKADGGAGDAGQRSEPTPGGERRLGAVDTSRSDGSPTPPRDASRSEDPPGRDASPSGGRPGDNRAGGRPSSEPTTESQRP